MEIHDNEDQEDEFQEALDEPQPNPRPNPHPRQPNRPVRLSVTPKHFTGKYGSDFVEYLHSFEEAAKCNYWDEITMLTQFPAYLEGYAAEFYSAATASCRRDGRGPWTWVEL